MILADQSAFPLLNTSKIKLEESQADSNVDELDSKEDGSHVSDIITPL